ncbi:prepilin peptidase [Candidatus Saccharibacteria bacterium]|nr:prepilin peptidase [Candidatus Saccharibacteria bacterium]
MLSEIIFLVIMFIFGAILGSFACCQAWRIHYKEEKKKDLGKWSVCLNCGKKLKPQENVPIFSWIFLKGKCKECGAKIGIAEILSEISLALGFVAVGVLFWPSFASSESNMMKLLFLIASFLTILIILVMLWVLMIYDAKWRLLPTKLLVSVDILAVIYLGFEIVSLSFGNSFWQDLTKMLPSLGIGIAILPGMYFLLYKMSNEKFVGSGDWLLALAVSLILGSWWLCLLVLFLSNFMASIAGIILKIKNGEKVIPFGPFLILAFIIVYSLQNWLMVVFAGLV